MCNACAVADAAAAPETAPQFQPEYVAPPVSSAYVPAQSAFHIPMTKDQLPEEFKPLGAWAYFGYNILFSIPLVGFILLLVFSLGGTRNINLRNYARSFFCLLLISAVLGTLFVVLAIFLGIRLTDIANEAMYY